MFMFLNSLQKRESDHFFDASRVFNFLKHRGERLQWRSINKI